MNVIVRKHTTTKVHKGQKKDKNIISKKAQKNEANTLTKKTTSCKGTYNRLDPPIDIFLLIEYLEVEFKEHMSFVLFIHTVVFHSNFDFTIIAFSFPKSCS